MENPQSLAATESFSYSWLTGSRRTSCDDAFVQSRLVENSREKESDINFNFDVPVTSFHVHADEIFSDGHIMPWYLDRSSQLLDASKPSVSNSTIPSPPPLPRSYLISTNIGHEYCLLGKWRRSSYKRILHKYWLGLVKPLCRTMNRCSRKSNRVDDLERKVYEVQSKSSSLETSPRPSSVYSVVEWDEGKKIVGKSDDPVVNGSRSPQDSPSYSASAGASCHVLESSIHEAILYCKRSIEN